MQRIDIGYRKFLCRKRAPSSAALLHRIAQKRNGNIGRSEFGLAAVREIGRLNDRFVANARFYDK